MENNLILLDTSLLIDFYRMKDKSKSYLFQLAKTEEFAISVITKYEFLAGTKPENVPYTLSIIENIKIKELDEKTIDIAIQIYNNLKNKNQVIDTPDILIAATAITNQMSLATLNKSDFSRIDSLNIL